MKNLIKKAEAQMKDTFSLVIDKFFIYAPSCRELEDNILLLMLLQGCTHIRADNSQVIELQRRTTKKANGLWAQWAITVQGKTVEFIEEKL